MVKTIIRSLFILTTIMLFNSFADLSTGLVGHWKFDEGSGTTVSDASGNGHHATIYGAYETGSIGDSIWEDGVSGSGIRYKAYDTNFTYWQIRAPYHPQLDIKLEKTLSAWVYYYNHPSADWKGCNIIAMKHHYYGCFAEPNYYKLRLHTTAGASENIIRATYEAKCGHGTTTNHTCQTITSQSLDTGSWHHVAVTHSSDSTARIFIDGVKLVEEAGVHFPSGDDSLNLFLGVMESIQSFNFNGDIVIDEIRLYNRALSHSEIEELYIQPENTIYVDCDANGNNDGTSWIDAYCDLQDAIANASAGDKIYVAEGVYKPTSTSSRTIAFDLKSDLRIFGGFDPSNNVDLFNERDWSTYQTILSGDIGTVNDSTDNSYHVLRAQNINDLNLDGFKIVDGYCDTYYSGGGGLEINNSVITIKNCEFNSNDNIAAGIGYGYGGAIFIISSSEVKIYNSKFINNSAFRGGAIRIKDTSSLDLINCIFQANNVENLQSGQRPTGGAVNGGNFVNIDMVNCLFYDNVSRGHGGAIVITDDSKMEIINSTFTNNTADVYGGAVWISTRCTTSIENSILWGNSGGLADNYGVSAFSEVQVGYSDVEGGYDGPTYKDSYSSILSNGNNININPNFTAPSSNNFTLSSSSLCIDIGNNFNTNQCEDIYYNISTDLKGNHRVVDGNGDEILTIDLGCYEYQP